MGFQVIALLATDFAGDEMSSEALNAIARCQGFSASNAQLATLQLLDCKGSV